MDLPVRKRLPHAVPEWVPDGSSFFITINCVPRGENHLCRAGVGDKVLEAARFNHGKLFWFCRVMLLMPDHVHGIVIVGRDAGLQRLVSNWKRYLARQTGISWQKDFFDHRLRDHHQLEEKVSYILMNPVRRGLCERTEEWPWVFRGTR